MSRSSVAGRAYCSTPSITCGAELTRGFVPRYSLSELLLGSWVPPDGSLAVTRVIVEHGVEALGPKLLSRSSALNALTISGVVGFGSVMVAPSGREKVGTLRALGVLQSTAALLTGLTQVLGMP